jgi:hypothetical protein
MTGRRRWLVSCKLQEQGKQEGGSEADVRVGSSKQGLNKHASKQLECRRTERERESVGVCVCVRCQEMNERPVTSGKEQLAC